MNLKKYTTLFLDRDGVINCKIDGYVRYFSEFNFIDGVLESISDLTDYFDRIIIVTNQQGIGKQLMTEKELIELHSEMVKEIEKNVGKIDKIYYCPHLSSLECNCRKPEPGMLKKAKQDFKEIIFENSILLGDSDTDILAAEKVGVQAVKVCSEYTLTHWTRDFLLN